MRMVGTASIACDLGRTSPKFLFVLILPVPKLSPPSGFPWQLREEPLAYRHVGIY